MFDMGSPRAWWSGWYLPGAVGPWGSARLTRELPRLTGARVLVKLRLLIRQGPPEVLDLDGPAVERSSLRRPGRAFVNRNPPVYQSHRPL